MRLPGTGDGVARLVEVSRVKVDIAARLLALPHRSNNQPRQKVGPATMWNINQQPFVTGASAPAGRRE
jgi:hypothetical protein